MRKKRLAVSGWRLVRGAIAPFHPLRVGLGAIEA